MKLTNANSAITDKKWGFYAFVTYAILAIFLYLRLVNLNYNAPFNDEAIYIVIGKLGVFSWNWWVYNANSWMAGNQLVYPSITALFYSIGGILGSRFFSVLMGVLSIEMIFRIAFLITEGTTDRKFLSGIISSIILGGSAISLYVSRLATYDIPSFYFLLLGIYLALSASTKGVNKAKFYLFSALFLELSFMTKIITGLYIPFVALISYLIARRDKEQYFYWKRYFLFPFVTGFAVYCLLNLSSFMTYFQLQSAREHFAMLEVAKTYLTYVYPIIPFFLLGSVGMLISRQWRLWLMLFLSNSLIVLFHLLAHRISTFDKHIFLSIIFLSLISGVGLSYLLELFPYSKVTFLPRLILAAGLLFYTAFSYQSAQAFNSLWTNESEMLDHVAQITHPGDQILTEYGAATMLATYKKDFPANVHTFDYFRYGSIEGDPAYEKAVQDGYFDIIELDNESIPKGARNEHLHNLVKKALLLSYQLIYQGDDSTIYRRVF